MMLAQIVLSVGVRLHRGDRPKESHASQRTWEERAVAGGSASRAEATASMERVVGSVRGGDGVRSELGARVGIRRASVMAAVMEASLGKGWLLVMSSSTDRAGRAAKAKRSMGKGSGVAPGKGARERAAQQRAIERRLAVERSDRRERGEIEGRPLERRRNKRRAASMERPPG
jgi:hypothetical protein